MASLFGRSSLSVAAAFCLIAIVVLSMVTSFAKYSIFRRMVWDDAINTHCLCGHSAQLAAQTMLDHSLGSTAEQKHTVAYHDYCSLDSVTDKQWDRFLFFITDGLSRAYAEDTYEAFREHSVSYTVHVPGYKFSHAIYTSWLTGELPWHAGLSGLHARLPRHEFITCPNAVIHH